LFDATGAFNPKALGDPTDVAGLLKQQGEEFIKEEKWKFSQQQWANPLHSSQQYSQYSILLEEATKNAMNDYLKSIKYDTEFKNRLVFPEAKFEFKIYNTLEGGIKVIVEPKQ